MMTRGGGSVAGGTGSSSGNPIDSSSSYFVPLPTVFEAFLGAVCALAYVAMLQQEYDDTFYASHAEMMRWYICTIATLVHNITIGTIVIVHRQRHRLAFLEIGGGVGSASSRHQKQHSGGGRYHPQQHHPKGSSSLPAIVIKMVLVVVFACWYDLVITLRKLRSGVLEK